MILEIDNIELGFGGKKILYGVYLKAELGKVTGILGRNGCGKTCLLKIIFGNLSPKYKSIRLNGKNQKGQLFKKADIAYLPQHQLLPKKIKLAKAFDLFGLQWEPFIDRFESFSTYTKTTTDKLSHGELRVVETYLILCSKKAVILLDEPFSFIAPLYIETFKELIDLKKKESIIIITDHFYREIMEVSNTLYLLKNGSSQLIKSKEGLVNAGYINPD